MSSIPPVNPDGQSLDYQAPPPVSAASANERYYATPPQPKVKQARDRAQYVRQQKGHSFIVQFLILGIFTVWILPIYYAVSPNHYYHI